LAEPKADISPESTENDDPAFHVAQGRKFWKQHMYSDAERSFARALALDPGSSMAHNNLGWVREANGDQEAAIHCYERALELSPSLKVARVNLATLLSKIGRYEDAKRSWLALATTNPGNRELLGKLIDTALRAGDLQTASVYSEEYASICHGRQVDGHSIDLNSLSYDESKSPHVTISKLKHDIEQFSYLRAQGVMPGEMSKIIERYEGVLAAAVGEHSSDDRWELRHAEHSKIGSIYNRIVYLRTAPRVRQALSSGWDRAAVEETYLHHPLGLVVIDDFLSDQALQSMRLFCLQSTIWFTNRYAYGRLGATFRRGFNCPLLIQIAQEIAAAFPAVIGQRHRLLQMWAYKCGNAQPATSAHADFAAVNVNFWLTPDEANLDSMSGGMIIYDVEAPMSWDFNTYNKQGGKIGAFLRERSARSITVPYRANRAVIFNSDLFHTTQPLSFHDGYENRRINVTLLFGSRERDLKCQASQAAKWLISSSAADHDKRRGAAANKLP
jgi:tetratricopeptide (TPR) repeat protein